MPNRIQRSSFFATLKYHYRNYANTNTVDLYDSNSKHTEIDSIHMIELTVDAN